MQQFPQTGTRQGPLVVDGSSWQDRETAGSECGNPPPPRRGPSARTWPDHPHPGRQGVALGLAAGTAAWAPPGQGRMDSIQQ